MQGEAAPRIRGHAQFTNAQQAYNHHLVLTEHSLYTCHPIQVTIMALARRILADGHDANLALEHEEEKTEKMSIYQGAKPPEEGPISKEESLVLESAYPNARRQTLIHFTSGSTVIPVSLNGNHSFETIIRPPCTSPTIKQSRFPLLFTPFDGIVPLFRTLYVPATQSLCRSFIHSRLIWAIFFSSLFKSHLVTSRLP